MNNVLQEVAQALGEQDVQPAHNTSLIDQAHALSRSTMSSATRLYGDPGTLYSRCGGVFGIASFADRCMDMWMSSDKVRRSPPRPRDYQLNSCRESVRHYAICSAVPPV